jgi:brefeldin A-resistance guanine nucleotide exchange factor 1
MQLRFADTNSWESVSERGYRSVNLMFELRKWLPELYQSPLSSTQGSSRSKVIRCVVITLSPVWVHYALPLLVALARQCTNSNRELRHLAVQNLQRIIMGPSASFMGDPPSPGSDEDIFNQILFPLVDDLLKAEVMQRDQAGMAETRLRACSLLCRAFLQYEIQAPQGAKDVKDIWLQILDFLEHLMNVNKRDPLVSAFTSFFSSLTLDTSMKLSRNHSKTWLWSCTPPNILFHRLQERRTLEQINRKKCG